MATDTLVEPVDATPAPTVEPTTPSSEAPADAGGLPDELLQIPAVAALLAGSPPAVSAPVADFEKLPEAQLIMANKDALMKAGMGTYRSLSGDLGVLFNRLYLPGEALQEADKAGKLQEIAPPFDQVNSAVSGAGENHPVLKHDGNVPKAFAQYQPTGAQPATPPPPAEAQKAVASKRVNAAAVGSPTSGPKPGAGRILNSILKSPV